MEDQQFPIRKGDIFRTGKEIEGLRGGVLGYAAQANPKIDAARTEKGPFRMETTLVFNSCSGSHGPNPCQVVDCEAFICLWSVFVVISVNHKNSEV
jgi:hypothetical protein